MNGKRGKPSSLVADALSPSNPSSLVLPSSSLLGFLFGFFMASVCLMCGQAPLWQVQMWWGHWEFLGTFGHFSGTSTRTFGHFIRNLSHHPGAMLVLQNIILPFRGLLCLPYFGPFLASRGSDGGLVPTNMSQEIHHITIQMALSSSFNQANGCTSTSHPWVSFLVLAVAKIPTEIGQQMTTPALDGRCRRSNTHQYEPREAPYYHSNGSFQFLETSEWLHIYLTPLGAISSTGRGKNCNRNWPTDDHTCIIWALEEVWFPST